MGNMQCENVSQLYNVWEGWDYRIFFSFVPILTRDGHAPILADAHRCASDVHNSHKPHQIVKQKSTFFDQNIVILDSFIFHS